MQFTHALTAVVAMIGLVAAKPVDMELEKRNATTPVTYLGSQSRILSGGATARGLVYTAGVVPSLNGSIVEGGIRNETAQVIANIAAILEEAGTSWEYVLKTTVYLANMSDYSAMNEVYAELLPDPKPARTAIEVAQLPGNFSIEVEAIAAVPHY